MIGNKNRLKQDRIGVCVIGSGRAGMIHARNFKTGVLGAELVVSFMDRWNDQLRPGKW